MDCVGANLESSRMHLDLGLGGPNHSFPMDIADASYLLSSLTPQFIPQQTIHAHLCLALNLSSLSQRNLKHLLWLCNLIHNAVLVCFLARPSMRLKQHAARNLRAQLQSGKEPNAREMQSKIDRWHGEESPPRIHDAVIVRQSKRTRAAKRMSRDQRDGRKGIVEQRGQQRKEAIAIGKRIRIVFVEVEPGAPELFICASCDHATLRVGAQFPLNVAQRSYDFLGESNIDPVFRRFGERNNEDAVVARDAKVGVWAQCHCGKRPKTMMVVTRETAQASNLGFQNGLCAQI